MHTNFQQPLLLISGIDSLINLGKINVPSPSPSHIQSYTFHVEPVIQIQYSNKLKIVSSLFFTVPSCPLSIEMFCLAPFDTNVNINKIRTIKGLLRCNKKTFFSFVKYEHNHFNAKWPNITTLIFFFFFEFNEMRARARSASSVLVSLKMMKKLTNFQKTSTEYQLKL